MTRTVRTCFAAAITLFSQIACNREAHSQGESPPLILEKSISLPDVKGRIDHLAIDVAHRRLFVAELGNGTVESVDLAKGQVSGRISGLGEPQGLAYLAAINELVVASADGIVAFYRAGDLSSVAKIRLGDDADNVRVDPSTGLVIVGYGDGALAIISAATHRVLNTVALPGHPESFRFDDGRRAFVNVPGAGKIAVVDLKDMKLVATRSTNHGANYPMLFDAYSNTVVIVYRLPARLVVTDANDGKVRQDMDICSDSDDLFLDERRHRVYVSCGGGDIDVLQALSGEYHRVARIRTRLGARTSLFVPELDRLYVAARAEGGKPAAVLVFLPSGVG
jgi:hypothetical protein